MREADDMNLMRLFGRTPRRMSAVSAPTETPESKRFVEDEHAILSGLTDRQLSSLFGNVPSEMRAGLQERHPALAERVHLYALRKLVAAVKQGEQEP